jgi:hypothetical protein
VSPTISIPWQCAQGHAVVVTYDGNDLQTAGELRFSCELCRQVYSVDEDTLAFISQLVAAIPKPDSGRPLPVPTRSAKAPFAKASNNKMAFLEASASK